MDLSILKVQVVKAKMWEVALTFDAVGKKVKPRNQLDLFATLPAIPTPLRLSKLQQIINTFIFFLLKVVYINSSSPVLFLFPRQLENSILDASI